MVLLSHQLSCILAGLFSAVVVITAPTGPLPGNANSFGLDMAVFIPVRPQTPPPHTPPPQIPPPQTPPPALPKTNPANMPPPANPATLHTPSKKPKGDGESGTGPPDPESTVPSDSESQLSSTDRGTEKENGTSNEKGETASTKEDNDTPNSSKEGASASVLAPMPATFGAAIAVISWTYI